VEQAEQPEAEIAPPPYTEQVATPEPVVAASVAPAAPVAKEHEAEESIDDYMTRLFARLNGGRGAASVDPQPAPAAAPQAPPTPMAGVTPAAPTQESTNTEGTPVARTNEVSAEPLAEADRGPLTMIPRRSAPEKQVDLSAMRQLANSSASSAIGASQRRQRTSSATIKLGAAAALGLFGAAVVGLASSGWIQGAKAPIFGFGAVLFVAGAFWLLQGLGLLILAWGGGKGTKDAVQGKPEPKEAEDAAK
jgi:hypothetical protein